MFACRKPGARDGVAEDQIIATLVPEQGAQGIEQAFLKDLAGLEAVVIEGGVAGRLQQRVRLRKKWDDRLAVALDGAALHRGEDVTAIAVALDAEPLALVGEADLVQHFTGGD